jgi:hypothetical protein
MPTFAGILHLLGVAFMTLLPFRFRHGVHHVPPGYGEIEFNTRSRWLAKLIYPLTNLDQTRAIANQENRRHSPLKPLGHFN